jgi:hypothetical protein
MKFTLTLFCSTIIMVSCKKDAPNTNEILGTWKWNVSHGSDGTNSYKAIPNANADILISFQNDFSFQKQSACVLPGPSDGVYEIKTLRPSGVDIKCLILKSQQSRDTFSVYSNGSSLKLSEFRPRPFIVHHEFSKY